MSFNQSTSANGNQRIAQLHGPRELMDVELEIPYRLHPGYGKYSVATPAQRQEILKSQSMVVSKGPIAPGRVYYNNWLKSQYADFTKKIDECPGFRNFWKYEPTAPALARVAHTYLAQKCFEYRFTSTDEAWKEIVEGSNELPQKQTGLEKYISIHIPSSTRIRVARNITFDLDDPISVYSDIEGETLGNIQIPERLTFEYTDVNRFDPAIEKDLAEAIEMAKDKENQITCECHSQGITNCFENPHCPCYRMNLELQGLQQLNNGATPTTFSSFNSILFTDPREVYFKNVGFACSHLCGCQGKCTNNSLKAIEARLIPIEATRVSHQMGFFLYSPVFIPAGTPFLELTGEMLSSLFLSTDHLEYAYQLTYEDDEGWKSVLEAAPFSTEYRAKLLKLHKKTFYLDFAEHGNISRMISHSCLPNMEVVRVYRKSLSPADLHLVLVSLLDIYPGTPLSIDYGLFLSEKLEKKCECRTFACKRSEDKHLTELSCVNLAGAIEDLQEMRKKDYFSKIANQ